MALQSLILEKCRDDFHSCKAKILARIQHSLCVTGNGQRRKSSDFSRQRLQQICSPHQQSLSLFWYLDMLQGNITFVPVIWSRNHASRSPGVELFCDVCPTGGYRICRRTCSYCFSSWWNISVTFWQATLLGGIRIGLCSPGPTFTGWAERHVRLRQSDMSAQTWVLHAYVN